MIKKISFAILSVICALLCGCSEDFYTSPPQFAYYSYRSRDVFANGISLCAAVRGGDEKAALDEMFAFADKVNGEISLTVEDSAVSVFNAAGAGEKTEISRAAFTMIEKALGYCERTDGAFNIAVEPLVRLWNVNPDGLDRFYGSAEDSPEPPTQAQIAGTMAHCNISDIVAEESDGRYYISKTDPELRIDLGAVAKGYIADECVRIARLHGAESAYVDVSGNISLLGEWYHHERKKYVRWDIGVTSPRPRGGMAGEACALSVGGDKTLVTSGDYVRYYETLSGGEKVTVTHIIDGRSGLPLGVEYADGVYRNTSDYIISATVICDESAKADAYATAVCLMDCDSAVNFLVREKVHGIIVTADDRMLLVGVTESDETGEEYFVRKDRYSGYKKYKLEEYAVE